MARAFPRATPGQPHRPRRSQPTKRSDVTMDQQRTNGPLTRRQVLLGGAAAAVAAMGSGLLGNGVARADTPAGAASAAIDLRQPTTAFAHTWERAIAGDWAKQALRRDYQDQLFA